METKVILKPLHKEPIEPNARILGSLIKEIEREVEYEGGTIDSYEELVGRINSRFNVNVDVDLLIKFYTPYICEQEAKYYEWWYEKTEGC